ncbi:MAG: hypothetical protein ACTSWW_07380 [Promethearchaeota archaeon]
MMEEEIIDEILQNWESCTAPPLSDVFFGQEVIKILQLLKRNNSNHQTHWPMVTNSLIVLTALSYTE